jgi:hypothetical protein
LQRLPQQQSAFHVRLAACPYPDEDGQEFGA